MGKELSELGLTRPFAKEMILCFTEANYCYGPEPDLKGGPGEVWQFGCDCGCEVYVKLYMDDRKAYCFSIHKAKYPSEYPYR
jgi:hypothetical protein